MKHLSVLLLTTVTLAAPAGAAILDDFNRPDAPSLGSGWTQQAGASQVAGNAAIGDFGSLATFNGGSGNTVSFDIKIGPDGTQYVAGVLGYGAGDNYFIKIQSNEGGTFDRYAFYEGNNGDGLFDDLSANFTEASVNISYIGTLATLVITPVGGAVQTYSYDYGFAPGGTGIGLGFFGSAIADNFGNGGPVGGVPEPASWAMLIAGFGLAGTAMRRRRALAA
jgi:hypothetical protein